MYSEQCKENKVARHNTLRCISCGTRLSFHLLKAIQMPEDLSLEVGQGCLSPWSLLEHWYTTSLLISSIFIFRAWRVHPSPSLWTPLLLQPPPLRAVENCGYNKFPTIQLCKSSGSFISVNVSRQKLKAGWRTAIVAALEPLQRRVDRVNIYIYTESIIYNSNNICSG